MTDSIPPFDKLDNFHLTFKGYDLGNIFNPYGWRIYVLFLVTASGLAWIFFGFDSCFDQLEWGGRYFLSFLGGTHSFSDVLNIMQYRYGIATHFSAAVIYGLMFYAISQYYEKVGIKRSLNLFMSAILTVFAVSIFEFSWNITYAFTQNQPWTITFRYKQSQILTQNLTFFIAGILFILFILATPGMTRFYYKKHNKIFDSYRFRINKKFEFLVLLSVGLWFLWFYYPLPTRQISVPLETGGEWFSSSNFPQTMYTVDLDPTDNVAIGEPYFVEDNIIHTVNTVIKIIWAYTIFYFGKVIVWDTKE